MSWVDESLYAHWCYLSLREESQIQLCMYFHLLLVSTPGKGNYVHVPAALPTVSPLPTRHGSGVGLRIVAKAKILAPASNRTQVFQPVTCLFTDYGALIQWTSKLIADKIYTKLRKISCTSILSLKELTATDLVIKGRIGSSAWVKQCGVTFHTHCRLSGRLRCAWYTHPYITAVPYKSRWARWGLSLHGVQKYVREKYSYLTTAEWKGNLFDLEMSHYEIFIKNHRTF